LAALNAGLQPNAQMLDAPITLPPIGGGGYAYSWAPKNYDGRFSGMLTLRAALENSKNLVTAGLLYGGIKDDPKDSLDEVCRIAKDAQLYPRCERFYPFVLGTQPVRLLDLAGFYAAIANEGLRPTPHLISSITKNGAVVYRAAPSLTPLANVDRAAVFQLRTMLQGVLARGTARPIAHHAPYVGGKTGTSDDENDAWFVGFSNDVTIAVWVGYDNARHRRTLGRGNTGGKVAVPIFDAILQAAWKDVAPKVALGPPSKAIGQRLVERQVDAVTGDPAQQTNGAITEYLRADRLGADRFKMTRRDQADPSRSFFDQLFMPRPGPLPERPREQDQPGVAGGGLWGTPSHRNTTGAGSSWRPPPARAPDGLWGRPR
jgi:penicillin-binding protein 1A